MNENSVKRYLYPCECDILVDSNGLLVDFSGSPWQANLKDLEQITDIPGGILLAEGGMGKTTFMEQLGDFLQDRPVHLLKLGEYVGDPGGFRTDFEASLAASRETTDQMVIFDGLDEAPDLAGAVLRQLRRLPESTSVWIASRDVTAIRSIQSEHPELTTFALAPLSETDVRDLANRAGVDGDGFVDAAARQALLPICAKPLGCEIALSVFLENGLEGVAQRDLWQRGIERLCDETPSPTRRLAGAPQFTLDEIVYCSAWVALCLALSDNHFVWNGEETHRPRQSLGISDLTTKHSSALLIRTTLERGVFSPLGDGRVAFSHPIYGDYLAALGFANLIPPEDWASLLLDGQRTTVFPQRAGIAGWLAAYNAGFLGELSAIQPELLLASADSVQAIGADTLCLALLGRAGSLSYRQRQSGPILSNLHRLRHERTPDIIRGYLRDRDACSSSIELATAIAKECEYKELAGVLADRVLDASLSLDERVDAAYAVCRLKDEEAKRRFRRLLPINAAEDPEDNLRGLVLRACWPCHLTPDELTEHLSAPQKPNHGGTYRGFLDFDLPGSLESVLDEQSAVTFLEWALPHINQHDAYDALGKLARCIYTICWKWAGTTAIAELLASGYMMALSEHRSPFLQKRYEGEHIDSRVLTREDILADVDGRFAVLKAVLSCRQIESHDLARIPFTDVPLYTHDDISLLFDRAMAAPSGPLVEQWAVCIKAVVMRAGLDAHADQIDGFHGIRPDLIDHSQMLRADMVEAAERLAKSEQRWKKEEDERTREHAEDQQRIDNEIKKALRSPDLKPESFVGLAAWLNSENGRLSYTRALDIQSSSGWGKLTEEEQSVMLDLAHRYLTLGDIEPTAPEQHQYSVACALNALRLLRPGTYADLSRNVWERCGVELLKAAMHDNLELLAPLFDTLSDRFPDVGTDALLEVVSQELQRGFTSIIRHWGSRLSDSQAEAILKMADGPSTDQRRREVLVDELVRNGKERLVRTYLDTLFIDGWDVPPNPEYHKLRRLAFVLSPASYIRQLLDAVSANEVWGRQWLEESLDTHDNAFLNAVASCEASDVADMYVWLHGQYPSETRPEHVGAYTPGPLDSIHILKDQLINHLTQIGKVGSAAAIERIFRHFPADEWLGNCILDARRAEQSNSMAVLSIERIKKLCERKEVSMRSGSDSPDTFRSAMEARNWLESRTKPRLALLHSCHIRWVGSATANTAIERIPNLELSPEKQKRELSLIRQDILVVRAWALKNELSGVPPAPSEFPDREAAQAAFSEWYVYLDRLSEDAIGQTPTPRPDVMLVTVNEHETHAICQGFQTATGQEATTVSLDDRVYRNLGTLNTATVYHALSEMGSGGVGAMHQTVDKAIRTLNPAAVIAVGVAFGINEKKQAIGDILLSRQLRPYDLQRVGDKIILRGDKPHASARLINHFEGFAQTAWKGAKVRTGVVLTGDKLIDNIDYRNSLVSIEEEAVGGEMEGAGLYVPCYEHKVDWIVIKAICDWADGNKSIDKTARQKKAAKNACEFLIGALRHAPLIRQK